MSQLPIDFLRAAETEASIFCPFSLFQSKMQQLHSGGYVSLTLSITTG